MHYLSTRNNQLNESFLQILFKGLSYDGGLFLPKNWPAINLKDLKGKTYNEVAHAVIYPFVGNEITNEDLKHIITNTYNNFTHPDIAPLVNLENNKYILELFYGPTYAFKDYALQFLGQLFSHVLKNINKKITVLGATSGDTGSAAINAFQGRNDIQVFILHPYKMVSEVQRRQMTTTNEKNIHNIALKGTFDDCQRIVKNLFANKELQSKTSLTAINSINWARIIAQSVYYFWAYLQLDKKSVNFIVPSGNFGNIFSARISKYMGLPIDELHIVTNENDILHRTISFGDMKIGDVIKTYSPSMDIQISSNFERQLFESANRNSNAVKRIMKSFSAKGKETISGEILKDLQSIYITHSVSNDETLKTIKKFRDKNNYLSDPHTATGLNILSKINCNTPTVSLACAHPAKFSEAIIKAINEKPEMPNILNSLFDCQENMIILENDINLVKSHILNLI